MLLHSKEVATGVYLVGQLIDKRRVRVTTSLTLFHVRLDDLLSMFDDRLLDELFNRQAEVVSFKLISEVAVLTLRRESPDWEPFGNTPVTPVRLYVKLSS